MKKFRERERERGPEGRKAKGRRFKGMRRVAGKSNGCRFEGRRRVAGSKECEASSGSRMVAGSKECEGSPLSLIGDGWLLTELHRRQFELHRRRLSLIATVGLKLNRNGLALCFFFFFLLKYGNFLVFVALKSVTVNFIRVFVALKYDNI